VSVVLPAKNFVPWRKTWQGLSWIPGLSVSWKLLKNSTTPTLSNVDDEILAIDDYRVLPQPWDTRLAYYRPGEHVTVLVARRDRLQRLAVTFGVEPPKSWQLEVYPDATAEQRARLAAWLGCPSTTVPAL
jgi:hypothetical protein